MTATPEHAPVIRDRYEILGVLGSGGFGAVYAARFYGRFAVIQNVALKVVLPSVASDELAGRLRDEARVLALLNHANIVSFYRLSLLEIGWAFAMEPVGGRDLAEIIESEGPLPACVALEIVAAVADALHYVWHQAGPDGRPLRAVHRDIKPQNLRLTGQGLVKVLDFGIAHAVFGARESLTAAGQVAGTLEYMAPERLDPEQEQGQPGDLYALGAVLYAMLAGDRLGPARPTADGHQARVQRRLGALVEARPDLPHPVLDLLWELTQFDPLARPDAGSVSARCHTLADQIEGPRLRAFAVASLGSLVEPTPRRDHEHVGRVLVELSAPAVRLSAPGALAETRFDRLPVPARAMSVRREALASAVTEGALAGGLPAPSTAPWLTITGVAILGAALTAGALMFLGRAEDGIEGASPTVAPSASVELSPPPIASASPPPSSTPEVVAPVNPAGPTRVTVRVEGQVEEVLLTRGAQRIKAPAQVGPGMWMVSVRFGDQPIQALGALTIIAGQPVTLRCDPRFATCTW